MANDLLNPPETDTPQSTAAQNGRPATLAASKAMNEPGLRDDFDHSADNVRDALLGKGLEERPVWADLFDNIHDLFFPQKLPPLELTSTPIPVADPMAVKRSPLAIGISIAVNLAILALLLFAFRKQINSALPPALQLTNLDDNIKPYIPVTPKSGKMGGGGGGGSHDIAPPIKGHLPKLEKQPLLQPQVPVLDKPKIAIEPAINVQQNIKLPDNPNLPNIGVLTSKNNVVLSNGQGSGGGMGTGKNGGIGSGNGNGLGPGTGGNTGGGLYRVGDGVSKPEVIHAVDAEFSDEARRAKYEGTVVVSLIVDAQGNPQNIRVVRSLGMGLDEKAVEAVQQYKFKPAIEAKSGRPVPVPISFEVRFRLY